MKNISQSLIRVYQDCPYRYYLMSIRKMTWPDALSVDSRLESGRHYHQLIRQSIEGIPARLLLKMDLPEDEQAVFRTWKEQFRFQKGSRVYAELDVSAVFAGVLWVGTYDALEISDEGITIYDWKNKPLHYESSPQTMLYRWMAKRLSSRFCGEELPAEKIRMIYWFAKRPAEPLILPYSETDYLKDTERLLSLAEELVTEDESAYPKTDEPGICDRCSFRSYCHPETGESVPLPEMPEEDYGQLPLFEDETDDNSEEIRF